MNSDPEVPPGCHAPAGASIDLDPDQADAAQIEPHQRQIILAPPGSGKTEVVAALLESLDEQGIGPFDEILAISFSRAAVAALRRRAGRGESPSPAIRTLDSLASRFLDEMDDLEWRDLSFDKRIARAKTLLEGGADATDLSMVKHLVIDEVQDLVGIRARLALAMVERLPDDAGFTLLGDPDQAIYEFQLENEHDITSTQFLDTVRRSPRVREIRLTHQYRARTSQAEEAARVLAAGQTGAQRTIAVRSLVSKIVVGGDVADVGRAASRWQGSTAFLCRTNGQALMVTKALRGVGCQVETRPPSDDLPIAPWIARTFDAVQTPSVRRVDIETRLAECSPVGADDAWRLLKEAERDFRTHDRLNLKRLRAAILRRDLPAELMNGMVGESILVSTIHRAKGLEFDNVVIVNPSDLVPGDASDEDVSVAYVAATRPRDRLMGARIELPRRLYQDGRTKRWIIGGYKKWQTFGFEVRGGDTEPVQRAQSNGLKQMPLGGAVTARLDRAQSSLDLPVYVVEYEGQPVASTTAQFGRTLARRLGKADKRTTPWPGLTGLAMESMETRPSPTVEVGFSFLELAVRVGGMASLDWGGEHA